MVLYRSPEYLAVKVNNEDEYEIPKLKDKIVTKKNQTQNFDRVLGPYITNKTFL